jgi:hypothetical protein
VNTVFDILLLPFRSLEPLWGLLWISALLGITMILVFKKTSDQRAISALRHKMGSRALGMLLFLESPVTVVKLASALVTDNFIYLWHLLKPVLIISIPFAVTAAQLDARYSREPLDAYHQSTVTVLWESSVPEESTAGPETGVLLSPVVTIIDSLEQSFSFAGSNGVFVYSLMGVQLGTDGQTGSVFVRGSEKSGVVQALFRPWNTDVVQGVASVHSTINEARYHILGKRWSWFTVFLVFSSIFAILGAVVFKVKV